MEAALDVVDAAAADGVDWLARALRTVELARPVRGISLCIVVVAPPAPPTASKPRKPPVVEDPNTTAVRETIERTFQDVPNVTITRGDRWNLTPVLGACAPAPVPEAQGSASGGGAGSASKGSASTP